MNGRPSERQPASGDIYSSARLAAAYVSDRPPVHAEVMKRVARRLGVTSAGRRRGRALDVGSGAGLSTAALAPVAERAVGVEPIGVMVRQARAVAPAARFVQGRAEALPFAGESVDLVTAAGSLNYADLDRALAEVARVLAPDGVLVVYDFSSGRRWPEDGRLDAWFDAFERRYPFPPGYAMDVRSLDFDRFGLRLAAFEPFEVTLGLDLDAYRRYALSETNVEQAVNDGTPLEEIAAWCDAGLRPLFGGDGVVRDVQFEWYAAYVTPRGASLPAIA